MAEPLTVQFILSNYPALVARAELLHLENYSVNRDFYRGGPHALAHIKKHDRERAEAWALRRKRLAGLNICGVVVDKIVTAEYGQPATRSFGGLDETVGEEFREAIDGRRLHPSRILTVRQRAIDGTAILNLYWDAERGKVCWKHERAEHVLPIVMDDWERVDAVVIDRARLPTGARSADKAPDSKRGTINEGRGDKFLLWKPATKGNVVRIVEIYTPTESAQVALETGSDGKIIKVERRDGDTDATGAFQRTPELQEYGCIPLVWFRGKRLVGDVFGMSMERGCVELNHAANEGLSTLIEVVRAQGFSLLVVQGNVDLPMDERGQQRIEVGEKSFLMIPEAEGSVYYADPNPKIQEAADLLELFVRLGMESGRVPMAVVQPQQSHAESGAARQVQFLPLIDLVNELETFDAESEFEFASMVVHIARRMGGQAEASLDGLRDELSAEFRVDHSESFYPTDQETELNIYERRRDLALETRRAQLQRMHPDLDEDGLDALEEEIDEAEHSVTEGRAFGSRSEEEPAA